MKRIPRIHKESTRLSVGPFSVRQPLPAAALEQWSPFLLLHHAGPATYAPGAIQSRLSPHPHRGFEPVTFLFEGALHHKDSSGNEGFLTAGDVQWMTAGSGIIHSEGPSEKFAATGGTMELIQLWVNLPRDFKMTSPRYQDIKQEAMPVIQENGYRMQLVAGTYQGASGPAQTFSPILAMMGTFQEGANISLAVDEGFNAMLYVLSGTLQAENGPVEGGELALYAPGEGNITLQAKTAGRFLFLAGAPILEPVVSYGPFVMNYPGEIRQAVLDYETGKMGALAN